MNRLCLSFILAMLIVGSPRLSRADSVAPTADSILEQLFRHAAMPIDKMHDCKSSFAHVKEKNYTLGRYLAELISNMEEAGDNQVRFSCQAAKGAGWNCDLEFQHIIPKGETSFSYGVRIPVDRRGTVQMKGLSCIGTG